ncbi:MULTISPECIES: BTAD domain-containing putative transcriptional regulator [unclassified Streptomyces]|uniref:BTAD domain-containing putative transcriptional regulator n=1 Tax=unclassified Streptomyces TaxID=2593676 RepID=UPI00037844BD|nr:MULTISPECIES: BTAD domain-containing putative transcriptional regulator [unclassified Streptomyces]MYT30932.1 LysM peptidoglycan-binding domain-containing protein [Streptomyces sp. SID8354]
MTHHVALRQRLTAAVTAIGTLALTLALLAGMPYVLWQAVGIPWPDSVHSWHELGERLAQPISDPLVIDLLAMVGWVCWAAFAFTVIREVCWYSAHLPQLLHDRRTHRDHVANLSLKGSLAALCIGTLVVALLSLWRPATAAAQQHSFTNEAPHRITATAPLNPVVAQQATPGTATTVTLSSPEATESRASAKAVRHIEYTVVEGDTLWDIAAEHLGDALKWPRIYALNKDRVQSDGARLHDPDRLQAGWRLTIPTSDHGSASRAAPPATDDRTPDSVSKPSSGSPTPPRPAPEHSPATSQQVTGPHALSTPRPDDRASGRKEEAEAAPGPAAIGFGEASLIGITAAAGLLAARRYWYVHQRRQREPDAQVPALSPLVDKAAQAAHAAAQPRRPRDPEALITRRTPPQAPRSADTVTIGVSDNTEVPLDVLATTGGCTWTGPGAEDAARALLTGILTAAERQCPAAPHVKAVVPQDLADCLLPGLPRQFSAVTQTADTAQAVRIAEQRLVIHARAQHDRDMPKAGPATADNADESEPGALLLLATPDAARIGQVQALAARSRPGILTVLTLGTPLPGAEHWNIATDGTTTRPDTHPQHPSHLELFRLTPDAGRDMTELLLGAHGQRPHLRVLPDQRPPSRGSQPQSGATDESEGEPGPASPHPTTASRPQQTKPVRLHVLGPVTLYARGHEDPVGTNLRPEVHEFLALLAAHPTGLLTSDIADKLQIEPDDEQNALKNLRRAVRRVLRAATGITAQEFILRQGELHKLHPQLVETDLADFTRTLKNAFSAAADSEHDALSAVREALGHYRGSFAQGADYLWADAIREHLGMQATDAALRLARQAEQAATGPQERDGVLALLEHLGSLHPDHERVTQHAIRLHQAAGRHDAARRTYARLERHLAELDLEPDPATQALITPRSHSHQMG